MFLPRCSSINYAVFTCCVFFVVYFIRLSRILTLFPAVMSLVPPLHPAAEQTVEAQVGSLRYRLHDSVRRFWLDLRRIGAQQREAQVCEAAADSFTIRV